jgi:hypothetical protein
MSATPFRQIIWAEILFVTSVILLWIADRWAPLGALFNPHSAFGGGMLLVLFCLGVVTLCSLLALLPWAWVLMFRQPKVLLAPRLVVTMVGAVEVVLVGAWLLRIH